VVALAQIVGEKEGGVSPSVNKRRGRKKGGAAL